MAYFIDNIPYEESEYLEIKRIIQDKPVDTFETVYRFNHESKMYEGLERTEEEKVQWYVEVVGNGTIILDEVPEEYYEEVSAIVNSETEEKYTLDEAAEILSNEVANEL